MSDEESLACERCLVRIQQLEAENDKLYKAFLYSQDLNRGKGVELADAICRIQHLEGMLAAYRSALRSGEPESEKLRKLADAALSSEARDPDSEPREKPWPRYPLFDSSKPPEKEGEDGQDERLSS